MGEKKKLSLGPLGRSLPHPFPMQVGKGRDVGLQQTYKFEAKVRLYVMGETALLTLMRHM